MPNLGESVRKRLTYAIAGIVATAAAVTIPQSPAAAAGLSAIVGLQSDKCIDVPGDNVNDNVQMHIWWCISDTLGGTKSNQEWAFQATTSDTRLNIRNSFSRKCLTVLNASMADNAPVIQFTCKPEANEEWQTEYRLRRDGRDYYRLKNRKSGKCLTVQNASVAAGAKLLQFTCNNINGGNQLWTW